MPAQKTKAAEQSPSRNDSAREEPKVAPAMAVFLENVNAVIARKNIRLYKMAEECGIARTWLSTVLQGRGGNVTLEYAEKIADYIGVPLHRLLKPQNNLSGKPDEN